MHGFNKVKRSPAERARHQLLRERGEQGSNFARQLDEDLDPETKTRRTLTTTVVVKATPTPVPVPPPVTVKTSLPVPPVVTTTKPLVTVPTPTIAIRPTTTSTTPATSTTPTTTTTPLATPSPTPVLIPTTSSTSVVPISTITSVAPGASDSASNNNATTSSAKAGGLSSAATGGIIAGCVFAALLIVIFVVRKTFISRRKRKRNTWGAGMYPAYTDKDQPMDAPPPIPEKVPTPVTSSSFGPGIGGARSPVWAPPRPESVSRSPVSPPPAQAPLGNPYYVAPPPMSYNNAMDDAYGGVSATPVGFGGGAGMMNQPAAAKDTAIVRVVYIPTLPDELSITAGEVVRVLKAFDDGWALCANARGEQGVVPVECLDMNAAQMVQSPSVGYGQEEKNGDWRSMRRLSSLSTQTPRY